MDGTTASNGLFPLNNSPGKMVFPVLLLMRFPFKVSMFAWSQYFAPFLPLVAVFCAISHSWCGNFKSIPPP